MRLVVNGAVVAESIVDTRLSDHTGDVAIGSFIDQTKTHTGDLAGDGAYFNGLVGEFTYYNESLTVSENIDLHAHLMNKWLGTPTSPDYETATSHDVTVQVTDAAGNSYTETMSVAIDNGLDANQAVPGPQFINEGQTLTFSSGNSNSVSVSDSIVGTDSPMQVSLSVNNGMLTLSQTTGLTFVEGSNGSGSLVIDGTESDINAALEGMTFTPNAGFSGEVDLSMTTSLAADLVGHYTFVDGTADDQAAGTAENGTFNGNATTTTDAERGEVLSLDGNGDAVHVSGTFGNPTDVTLATWVNLNAPDIGGSHIVSLGNNVVLWFDTDTVRGTFWNGSSFLPILADFDLTAAGWTHLAYTIDDGNAHHLYINGEAVSSHRIQNRLAIRRGQIPIWVLRR